MKRVIGMLVIAVLSCAPVASSADEIDDLVRKAASSDVGERIVALHDLRGHQDERSLQALVLAVQDEDPAIRHFAVDALGEVYSPMWMRGTTDSDRPLRALFDTYLRDREAEIRSTAAKAMARLSRTNIHALVDSALSHEDPKIRAVAVLLFTFGTKWESQLANVRPRMHELVGDGDVGVRTNALHGLAQSQRWGMETDIATLKNLVSLLSSEERALRVNSCAVLAMMADSRTSKVMITKLGDADAQIRTNAAAGLLKILFHARFDTPEKFPGLVAQLRELGIVEALLASLDDVDKAVRLNAVFALGILGDSSVANELAQLRSDPEQVVGQAASKALDWMQGKGVEVDATGIFRKETVKAEGALSLCMALPIEQTTSCGLLSTRVSVERSEVSLPRFR